jgi:hypothetical protein
MHFVTCLMWCACVVCLQLVIFSGLEYAYGTGAPVKQSTQVHVVDLMVRPLRWRTSTVINISTYGLSPLAFPCTGAASVPDQKVIALKHNKVSGGGCLDGRGCTWRNMAQSKLYHSSKTS